MTPPPEIRLDNVSKFYGEVLGVNGVTLSIPPGITSLVGPNGSGKTTLMNLLTGLIRPDRGSISVRGLSPSDPERLMRILGYATQYDTAPRRGTGFDFVVTGLLLCGHDRAEAEALAWRALQQLGLTDAAHRRIAGYSKGMRQRVRLARAMAHEPAVLVLDEPLNGLDPLVRAQTISLFRAFAARGRHVLVSSHVLQEVDAISERVVLMSNGMIVAEGDVRGIRDEIPEQPVHYLLRCERPAHVAALLFNENHVTEVRLSEDGAGLLALTRDRERFARALSSIAAAGYEIDTVIPADDDVHALYTYLVEDRR